MICWADIKAACIDKVVAVFSGIVYGTRYRRYLAYLAGRQQGRGFPNLLLRTTRAIGDSIGIVANRLVLRLLALLPPDQGERLFLCLMTLKKRRRKQS